MQFLTAQDVEGVRPAQEELVVPTIEGGPLDLERSLRVARALPAVLGRCWYNARGALLQMPAELFHAWYIEGWLVSMDHDGICVREHGWIRHPRSGVIDPTLVLETHVPAALAYFPGLRLPWAQLQQQYATNPLPLARHLPHLADLAYREACQRAQERAEALAWQTGLPVLAEPGMVTAFRREGSRLVSVAQTSWDFPVPPEPSARVAALLWQQGEHL
jgi:hypothetical protein